MPRLLSRRLLRLALLGALGLASLGAAAARADAAAVGRASVLSKLVPVANDGDGAPPSLLSESVPSALAAPLVLEGGVGELDEPQPLAAAAEPLAQSGDEQAASERQQQQAAQTDEAYSEQTGEVAAVAAPAPAAADADADAAPAPPSDSQPEAQQSDSQSPLPRTLEGAIGDVQLQPDPADSALPAPGATEGTDTAGQPIDGVPPPSPGIAASLTAWQIALCAVGGFLCCSFVTGGTHRACGGHLGNDCEALCACIAGCICFECCRGGGGAHKEPLLG